MSYPHLRSQWHHDDLAEDFSVSANDIECLDGLQTGNRKKANRLGLIMAIFAHRHEKVKLALFPRPLNDGRDGVLTQLDSSRYVAVGVAGLHQRKDLGR